MTLVKFAVLTLPFVVFALAVEHVNYPDQLWWWLAFTAATIARDVVNDG